MYKCTECQAEYKIKPDYCDCGNDTFDELKETIKEEIKKSETVEPQINQSKVNNNQTTTKTDTSKLTNKNDNLIGIISLIICLILSIIIIFIPTNTQPDAKQSKQENSKKTNLSNIPDIEKIWNNETPKRQTTDTNKNATQNKTTNNITIKNTQKPSVTTLSNTTKNKGITKSNQKTTTNVTPKKQTVNKTTKTVTQTKPKTSANQTITNKQEISKYIINLRNHIASKIDFTTVVGDGGCSFTFKINSNGYLIEKKTNHLSDNESLNETVYNALRQTISYNTPPTNFDTQKDLKLLVKMYNGTFEVHLNQ